MATRDEVTLARALYSTPLRTDSAGRIFGGLCDGWKASTDLRTWRFHCRSAPAIAAGLQRVGRLERSPSRWLFRGARIAAPNARTVVVRLPFPWRRFPFALTAIAAAPRGVPGPFRVVRASRDQVVARAGARTLVFRRLEAPAAVQAFRKGELDEAPVPLGDVGARRADPALRLRELVAADTLVLGPTVPAGLRRAYRDTANRADYAALVAESWAALALGFVDAGSKPDPAAFRRAVKAIPSLPRVEVRIAASEDPVLGYGARLLYGQWREAGLGPAIGADGPVEARFERLTAAYPQAEALPAALVLGAGVGGRPELVQALAREDQRAQLEAIDRRLRGDARAIAVAWVVDARLVSPVLRGWRQDLLGAVDYTQVQVVR